MPMELREASSDQARQTAERALASGQADDPVAVAEGRLLDPVRIRAPDGGAAGWIIPIGREDTLLGFVQVDESGRFRRYASLRRGTGAGEPAPKAADWLDTATILGRAATLVEPGETLGAPELSYDRSPDRLAWVVRAARTDGQFRTIYVAGTAVWESLSEP
jgi:hypothetical protein